MKYDNYETRLDKLAEIYNSSSNIEEYKIKADVQNINRKNYLFMFDPIVIYWLNKQYGNLLKFGIGLAAQVVFTFAMYFIIWKEIPSILAGALIAFGVMLLYDYGLYIGDRYVIKHEKTGEL